MPAGRPRIYTDAEELELATDQYFVECKRQIERPTVTGLALFLGFASKQSLYDYEKEEAFSYPIKKALLKVEHELEKKLDGNNVTGVIFALKNMGWKDKTEVESNNTHSLVWHEEKTYEADQKANAGS